MNVMIYNKYKELLLGLNIDVMKSMEGIFNVDEIIDTFSNYYYDKMILDITAIRDYQNIDNLQKLAMNINMDNVVLLLDDSPESSTKEYLSKLISLGIYNFTKNSNGINYLLVHPHSYRDVADLHTIDDFDNKTKENVEKNEVVEVPIDNSSDNNKSKDDNAVLEKNIEDRSLLSKDLKIIGFKNVTNHAGSTTLIYMVKKYLSEHNVVAGIEVNKVDFLYFNDNDLISTTTVDLPKEIMKRSGCNYILIDLNDYDDESICNEIYYLIEPSTIMINKMLKRNKNILLELKDKKVLLNKCLLNTNDIAEFEYETKLKVIYSIPPCDDRKNHITEIEKFVNSIIL